MNLDSVRKIADAVLYEGYILYPYRASAQKNRSRWQFGVVMAPGYAAADPSETSFTRAECVLEHSGQPEVRVLLRFLQVQRRTGQSLADYRLAPWTTTDSTLFPHDYYRDADQNGECEACEHTAQGGRDAVEQGAFRQQTG